jgi:hypothetical protein
MNSVYLIASTEGKACADPLPSCVHLCARVQSSLAGALCLWSAGHLDCKLLSVFDTVTCDLLTPDPSPWRSSDGAAAVHGLLVVALLHVQVQLQNAVREGKRAEASLIAFAHRGTHCPQATTA